MWSCSNPSQPWRASRCTRSASPTALERWTTKYGLVAQKATAEATRPIASRRHCRQPATTSGTSKKIPGYLKLIASPAATPASSIRPATINASATATPSVSGTSVTAIRE